MVTVPCRPLGGTTASDLCHFPGTLPVQVGREPLHRRAFVAPCLAGSAVGGGSGSFTTENDTHGATPGADFKPVSFAVEQTRSECRLFFIRGFCFDGTPKREISFSILRFYGAKQEIHS